MENQIKPSVIADGVVVSLDYTLKVDGKIFEASPAGEPIQFIQGHGHIIPGLENQLYGLAVGDQKEIFVAADEGYGDRDPDAFMEVAKEEFPDDIPLALGTLLQVQDEDGEDMDATITAVSEDTIELDFNHPLAGKDLTFGVQVVDLRNATEEEIEHGHVHGDDAEEEDFE